MIKDSPFRFVDAINKHENLLRNEPESVKSYNSWMVSMAFSYYPDTILYVNENNINSIEDNFMHFEHLLYSIRPMKRYPRKWHKPIKYEDIELIADIYGISYQKASEYGKLLSKEQMQELRIIKGEA